jgi:hypothetical protein
VRVLRTLVGRHLRKFMGELHACANELEWVVPPILCRRTEVRKS